MEVCGTDFVVYQISDLDRSIGFYRDTLGLELEWVMEEMGWAEFSVQPTTLAISDEDTWIRCPARLGGAIHA